MRWQIAEYIFCDQQQTLTFEQNTQQLEPMAVELLSYFCQHNDQIISKDQLIDQVWLGRIVTDNAVSKLITKLRKAFNDNARQPKFIATFPKKGYKFIAPAIPLIEIDPAKNQSAPVTNELETTEIENTQISDLTEKQNSAIQAENSPTVSNKPDSLFDKRIGLFILLLLVVFVAIFIGKKALQEKQSLLTHAKALTSAAGNEYSPSVSPDGSRIAYMSFKAERMHLMIKDIANQQTVEIKHEEGAGVGPASWSFDGRLLVYLVATPERCQYFMRSIEGLKVGEAQLIHNCPAGSYGKIAFTHDNNRLIFTESDGGNSAYSLFEINLKTQKKTRLSQPEIFLGGNSQFDMHPTENKLLISSPDKQQWEGFYSLDLESNELQLLFKQDAYICCGIWSHDGNRVVLMGEYPAYQILSYDLAGKDNKVIYSGSRKIDRPIRHSNGQDYLFISGQQNSNVRVFDLIDKQHQVIADATVDDRLATFAHQQEAKRRKVAYVSLATGNEEIWLTDIISSQRKKLTDFNDSRHYVDLQWSPNDKLLIALTFNEIHLIDASSGKFERLKLPQTEIRGVSFKDDKTLAFSRKNQGKWQVYFYQLDSHSVLPAAPKWQYIQFASNKENTLWFDQNKQLYWGEEQQIVDTPELLQPDFLSGRSFNLKKRGQNWFWYDTKKNYSLMQYSEQSEAVHAILPSNVFHFDVIDNKILFSQTISANTDIYQTQSLHDQ